MCIWPYNVSSIFACLQDNSVRLWLMDPVNHIAKCVGVGSRHTLSVGSVAFGQLSASFFLSVSQDLCLKLWRIPKKLNPGNMKGDSLCKDNVMLTA